MPILIGDGAGTGATAAVRANRLDVSARSNSRVYYRSREGKGFAFTSTFATGGTNVDVLYIQNREADTRFVIDRLVLASSVAQVWTGFEATGGTAAGTSITPVNLNFSSSKTFTNTSFGNAAVTGSLTGNTLFFDASTAGDGTEPLEGGGAIILGNGDKFAIRASANGTVYATVWGYSEFNDV